MLRNMDYNVATVAVLVFVHIFFRQKYRIGEESGKRFNRLAVVIMSTAILNIVADSMLLLRGRVPIALIYAVYAVYLVFVECCSYAMFAYTNTLVNSMHKITPIIIFNRFLMLSHLGLSLTTYFNHLYIYIPETGPVVKGPLYMVIYLISGYYLIYSGVTMVSHFAQTDSKQLKAVVGFIGLTFTGAVAQYFLWGDNIVIYFIFAIATMVLLFAFETPDFENLIKTTEQLQKSQAELELERKRAAELSATVNELSKIATWVIYFDEDGGVSEYSWSPEFIHLLGYDEDSEIDISTLWTDSLHPEDKQIAVDAFFAGMNGAEYDVEARLANKNGEYRWYECFGELKFDEDGRALSYQGFIRDVDDEKKMEQLMAEKSNALEKLEKSQAELKKALFDATEANKAKTIFLSNMSHDIRTPMNAIVGYTQLARENIGNRKEVEDCLSTIISSGEHLLALINDVLDMSRIESGKVNIDAYPYNLRKLMDDIKGITLANALEKKQLLTCDNSNVTDSDVYCDRLRLNQILINCVGNAIKYTPEGGKINVALEQAPSEKKGYANYIFTVKDNGIGMSEEFMSRIFDPFERDSANKDTSIQGTGLGMAITKNLVSMMGGNITVKSKLGEGSEFIITIPFKLITDDKNNESEDRASDDMSTEDIIKYLENKHFLVVDDNRLNRRIVKKLFEARGMIVEECESGQEAIDRLNNAADGEFAAVFMDIQMPGMNGYETVDIIRASEREYLKNVVILAMTANAFEEDKRMAIEHGMNGHVTKPFKLDKLIETIYTCIKYHHNS